MVYTYVVIKRRQLGGRMLEEGDERSFTDPLPEPYLKYFKLKEEPAQPAVDVPPGN